MQPTRQVEPLQLLRNNDVHKSALNRNTLEEIELKKPLEIAEVKRKNLEAEKRTRLQESRMSHEVNEKLRK